MYSGVYYDKIVKGNMDEHTPNNSISSHENITNLNTIEEKRVSKAVLIVDDDPDMTSIFSLGLQDEGFEVYTFNDSLEVCLILGQTSMILCLLISICQK
jgi:PleD family two-component response regulator